MTLCDASHMLLLLYKLCVGTMLVVCTLWFTWHTSVVWLSASSIQLVVVTKS